MNQYLVAESAEPMQTQSALTPNGAVPQVPTRQVASGPQRSTLNAGSRIVDLIAGTAKVGIGAATLVAVEITSRSIGIARVVAPASIAEGPLDAVERHLGRRQGEAQKSERENRDNVAEAAESVLNRVVVGVVDMLDMEQLIDHVPINKVVARVDLPGVIDEIDLAGVSVSPRPDWVQGRSTLAVPDSWPWICGAPEWSTGSSDASNRVTWVSDGMALLNRRIRSLRSSCEPGSRDPQ